ncbi:hypothetical protein WA026_012792 [Henosepilachna vigintioctopunctata]|uniref:Uncharacterized protein n=1 Tax=Henosepilachna vigintioctopunctata TaxID=420089 RepID=A0AAW1U6B8_9CUCU
MEKQSTINGREQRIAEINVDFLELTGLDLLLLVHLDITFMYWTSQKRKIRISKVQKLETIVVKDEDSDCEIVAATQGQVDVPEYIDPKSLSSLLDEHNELLPPVIEKIVSKLSNDEEFDRECDKYYKANLEMDVENVQVDVVKVLSSPPR